MARPRKLPDADVLHRHRVVEGLTYDQIAEKYDVTRAAVHLALRKSGLIVGPEKRRYTDEIPWKVAIAYANNYHLAMLRLAARKERGEPIPVYKEKYLDRWLKVLEDKNAVVHYDPQRWPEEGFGLARRREGVDTWLIRDPNAEATTPTPKKRGGARKLSVA